MKTRRFNHRRNAFTLIELLLVMVILVVLAAIVVPKFTSRSEQAKTTATITQINLFDTCLDQFEVDCGRYPTTEEGLRALVEQPANVTGWKPGGYIKEVPADQWKNPYVYRFPGSHNASGPDIFSMGADGHEGGTDDIGNWSSGK